MTTTPKMGWGKRSFFFFFFLVTFHFMKKSPEVVAVEFLVVCLIFFLNAVSYSLRNYFQVECNFIKIVLIWKKKIFCLMDILFLWGGRNGRNTFCTVLCDLFGSCALVFDSSNLISLLSSTLMEMCQLTLIKKISRQTL